MNPQDVFKDIDMQTRDLIIKAAETLTTDTFSPEDRSVFAPENITPIAYGNSLSEKRIPNQSFQ